MSRLNGRITKLEKIQATQKPKQILLINQRPDGRHEQDGRLMTEGDLQALKDAGHQLIIERRDLAMHR